jgi:hypothetical protein
MKVSASKNIMGYQLFSKLNRFIDKQLFKFLGQNTHTFTYSGSN